MSLDVYLVFGPGHEKECPHCGMRGEQEVYAGNITHNLNRMADAAGLYETLWRPEEKYPSPTGGTLIGDLRAGLNRLHADPNYFRQFDASNGWGTYEQFLPFVAEYLAACEQYPSARVRVSR